MEQYRDNYKKYKYLSTIFIVLGCFILGIIFESLAIVYANKSVFFIEKHDTSKINGIKIRLVIAWFLLIFTASTSFYSTDEQIIGGIILGGIASIIAYFVLIKNIDKKCLGNFKNQIIKQLDSSDKKQKTYNNNNTVTNKNIKESKQKEKDNSDKFIWE